MINNQAPTLFQGQVRVNVLFGTIKRMNLNDGHVEATQ